MRGKVRASRGTPQQGSSGPGARGHSPAPGLRGSQGRLRWGLSQESGACARLGQGGQQSHGRTAAPEPGLTPGRSSSALAVPGGVGQAATGVGGAGVPVTRLTGQRLGGDCACGSLADGHVLGGSRFPCRQPGPRTRRPVAWRQRVHLPRASSGPGTVHSPSRASGPALHGRCTHPPHLRPLALSFHLSARKGAG